MAPWSQPPPVDGSGYVEARSAAIRVYERPLICADANSGNPCCVANDTRAWIAHGVGTFPICTPAALRQCSSVSESLMNTMQAVFAVAV